MNNAIVVVHPQGVVKNIGDYVQTIAIKQYYTNATEFIDREKLHSYKSADNSKTNVIVNGCYVWNTGNWPPSEDLNPLFISMHIFPMAEKALFSEANVAYWKKHEPIECRDLSTLKMFQRHHIDSYYSSCVTLTLGEKYKFYGKREGVYFVDPYIPLPLFKDGASFRKLVWSELLQTLLFYRKHRSIINKLSKHEFFGLYGPNWGHSHYKGIKQYLMKHYHALQFYRIYSQTFTDELMLSAEYVTHMYRLKKDKQETDDDLCNIADNLIKKYAHAEFVITSRIHSALPCLGLETPVIFCLNNDMESSKIKFNTPGRFDGIIDFFRILRISKDGVQTEDQELLKLAKISSMSKFHNKDNYKKYAEKLKGSIQKFISCSNSGGVNSSNSYTACRMAA